MPKLTPITGHARAEVAGERAEHRPVAAEHDGEVDVCRVPVRGVEAVLLGLLLAHPQLDAGLAGDGGEPRERGPDRLRLAVRDHGGALDRAASGDCVTDSLVDVIQEHWVVAVDQVDEELAVALRAGQP